MNEPINENAYNVIYFVVHLIFPLLKKILIFCPQFFFVFFCNGPPMTPKKSIITL